MQKPGSAPACAAALLFLSLAVSAQTTQQSAVDVGIGKPAIDISEIRIQNFGRIDNNYYRGAQPRDRDYSDLAALGIRTVVNLTSFDALADEKAKVEGSGMQYFQIPMTTRIAPTSEQIDQFLDIVTSATRQPVYIHCVGGRHRTGVMTAVYRMIKDGWTSDRAFKEMKQYKFGADFLHPEFKRFVYSYQPLQPPALLAPISMAEAGR
jgi:protein tyrosine phosphatase (PTP) superfamily phosphohydrolase (DUF442 family)